MLSKTTRSALSGCRPSATVSASRDDAEDKRTARARPRWWSRRVPIVLVFKSSHEQRVVAAAGCIATPFSRESTLAPTPSFLAAHTAGGVEATREKQDALHQRHFVVHPSVDLHEATRTPRQSFRSSSLAVPDVASPHAERLERFGAIVSGRSVARTPGCRRAACGWPPWCSARTAGPAPCNEAATLCQSSFWKGLTTAPSGQTHLLLAGDRPQPVVERDALLQRGRELQLQVQALAPYELDRERLDMKARVVR